MLLLQFGAHPEIVAWRLGHQLQAFTDPADLSPGMQVEAAEALADRLFASADPHDGEQNEGDLPGAM